ncbi:Transmembrane protein 8B [Cichlidogyrus casuarinus]|uniref:Transmembrane protein 8B n=1 Tax=Cichlidogyrus casuarinus TaxID=1844966 RepID=A0ABD2Q4C9_9PLAT
MALSVCPRWADQSKYPSSVYNSDKDDKVSLLPWINPSWPCLVSRSGVCGEKTANTSFPRCILLPSASSTSSFLHPRVLTHNQWQSYPQPSLVAVFPWLLTAFSFDLLANKDSVGSLEISLQLNALDIHIPYNETHIRVSASSHSVIPCQRPKREVILHGCFSRSIPQRMQEFAECHYWLRLATIAGLYTPLAKAVSSVWATRLEHTRPAHRAEQSPQFDTSFNASFDRSYLFLPYPQPGRWYLTLFAECYSIDK